MTNYNFPFDTCEKNQYDTIGIAQPYSVFVNLITCSIVLYYLNQTKTKHSFYLLLSLFIFETFHTLSHLIHIKGPLLPTITHIAGFIVNITFINYMIQHTNVLPSNIFKNIVLGIILIDAYAFFNLSFIYFVASQICLFMFTLSCYYNILEKSKQISLLYIMCFSVIIYLLFVNEKINCKKMQNKYPNFPFHILIEIISIIPIYLLASVMSK